MSRRGRRGEGRRREWRVGRDANDGDHRVWRGRAGQRRAGRDVSARKGASGLARARGAGVALERGLERRERRRLGRARRRAARVEGSERLIERRRGRAAGAQNVACRVAPREPCGRRGNATRRCRREVHARQRVRHHRGRAFRGERIGRDARGGDRDGREASREGVPDARPTRRTRISRAEANRCEPHVAFVVHSRVAEEVTTRELLGAKSGPALFEIFHTTSFPLGRMLVWSPVSSHRPRFQNYPSQTRHAIFGRVS